MLSPGDRVRLVASGAAPDQAAALLTAWGLAVDVATHRTPGPGSRAAIRNALHDPATRAVIVVGDDPAAHRIPDGLDLGAVRAHPTTVVGLGGITHPQLALWRECGRPAVFGAVDEDLHRALMTPDPVTLSRRPGEYTAPVHVPGSATGTLLGGTLTALRDRVGAGLPDLTGAILLLTDRRTIGLGQVDRQLTHLRRAGVLAGVRGVALGRFTGFDGYADRGWTLLDVLRDQLTPLGVPVLGGLPVGDGPGAVRLGTAATLDADTGTLTSWRFQAPLLP